MRENNLHHDLNTYVLFLGFLADNDYEAVTIKNKINMLKFRTDLEGLEDFSSAPKTKLFVAGLKNAQRKMPPKKIKRPVTYATLQRLIRVMPVCCETRAEELLMNAMSSVAFYGLLRVGEMTLNINPKTVILREDMMLGRDFIKLVIRNSKCRQMEEIELVETRDNTCPVRALREYMDLHNHPTGPLFVQRWQQGNQKIF